MRLSNKLLSLAVLILFFCKLSAQDSMDEMRLHFQDAEYFLLSEDYSEALSAYLQLHRIDDKNANINYRIGLCYLNIPGQKRKSIPFLEYAAEHISEKYSESTFNERSAPPHTLFLLATAYQINNQLDEAKESFDDYKNYLKVNDVYEIDFVNKQIQACKYAVALMKEPLRISKNKMEGIIPEVRPAFNAVLSDNGEMLIYMTKEKFYNAIWMIRKINDQWKNPVNITPQTGSDGDCYPSSISKDGDTLYLVRLNNFGSNIYVSYFNNNVWSKIDKLPRGINTRFWETHASISIDGNTLFFVSNRKNGHGGRDIYMSQLDDKGKWQDPVNLGPIINTPYNEETPFIDKDGKTLYFSSQGHAGMGGFDVFESVKQEDNSWSVPINLGYPVNTTDDNTFYYPLGNGTKALYAGNLDENEPYSSVKEITYLPEEMPRKEINLMGKVIFEDNPPQVDSSIMVLLSNISSDSSSLMKVDLSSGSFNSRITPGNYRLSASADGYTSESENIDIPEDYQRSDFSIELELTPEKVSSGEYVIIKNILFNFDSYELTEEAILEIERLFQVMQEYPDLYIEVLGHTDSKGSPVYNFELSKNRAHAVTDYLVNKGIDPVRFVTKGLGETFNIALNTNSDGTDNPEGRRLNRNAEIRILQPDNYNITLRPIPVPDHLRPSQSVEYTILLATSQTSLEKDYFKINDQISQDEVSELFNGKVYTYSLGKFFSRTQAEEVKNSLDLNNFPNSTVINSDNLENISFTSSIIRSDSEKGEFGIQLAAIKEVENYGNFGNMDDVNIYKCTDGFYRVIYGDYQTRKEAETDVSELKSRGYLDAFVIDRNFIKKRIANTRKTAVPDGDFTIQVKALKTPVGSNFFHNLSGIRAIEGSDGIFRYIYGEFTNRESAEIELAKIKEKGYPDAFIRSTDNIQ